MYCGSAGSVFDLLAQPLDQRVDAALGDVRVAAPDPLHQRVAAEHDAAVAREHVEQVELVRGQLDVAIVEPRQPPRRIDEQPGDGDRGVNAWTRLHQMSFGRATGRHFAKYISALLLGIGFIIAAFTAKKQALHDLIAETLVLRR